ncbi:unnamed protein product [Spodoptera exigua]|nr:unnamed protein product [Spodoptera exigua]
MVALVVLAVVTSTAIAAQDTDVGYYYELPRLFHLDDWEECAARDGRYCLGTFDLMRHQNDRLYNVIQHVSRDRYRFNHTRLHRGLCLPSSCAHFHEHSPRAQFSACVTNMTQDLYGLETNLTELQYCKTAGEKRPLDQWDLSFLYGAGLLLLANVLGTAYHVMASKDGILIKQLMAWSLVENWRRLTADHSKGGDARLSALKPIQGMKALTLVLVMLAHSVLAYHLTYLYNPRFFEESSHHILSAYLQNGTSIVQTFIMVSSFLLAYNLLLHSADNPKKQLSLKMFPRCLVHRIARISPLYVFVLGLAATWWAHAGDGPLWSPMVEDEAARCRNKWWPQVLFVNNVVPRRRHAVIHHLRGVDSAAGQVAASGCQDPGCLYFRVNVDELRNYIQLATEANGIAYDTRVDENTVPWRAFVHMAVLRAVGQSTCSTNWSVDGLLVSLSSGGRIPASEE